MISLTDTFYAFRFLRLLTTPWKKMGAYKLGLIDAQGRLIRSPQTDEEKSKFTLFHRLVFNIKRTMNKIPLGKSTLASYIAALWLLKEHAKIDEKRLTKLLEREFGIDIHASPLNESRAWFVSEDNKLQPGNYILYNEIALPKTGELFCRAGSVVIVKEALEPIGSLYNTPVYKVLHHKTNQYIFVTSNDLAKSAYGN